MLPSKAWQRLARQAQCESIDHLAMALRQFDEIVQVCRSRRMLSSGASASRRRVDQRLRPIEFGSRQRVRGAQRRCSAMTLAASQLLAFRRGTRKVARKPAAAGAPAAVPRSSAISSIFDRALQRILRVAPSRNSGCFSSASSVGGSSPFARGLGGQPRENARRRVHQRIAAGIVERRASSGRAPPSRAAPARGRASPAPRILFRCSRLAHRHRDRQRLHFRIGAPRSRRGLVHAARAICAAISGSASAASCHCAVGARRPHRLGCQHLAAACAGAENSRHRGARCRSAASSACIANCGWSAAGAAVKSPCASLTAADRLPCLVVELGVEAGQHHGALRQPCDRCRNFAVDGIEPVEPAAITGPSWCCARRAASASISAVAPRRRFDLRRSSARCPAMPCARSVRKSSVMLPVFVELRPAPARRARPSRRRASPCRPSAAPGRRRAPASTPGRRPPAALRIDRSFRPMRRSSWRQRQPALEFAERRRDVERRQRRRCRPSAKASSSSSMSPSATMRGRITASVFEHIEEYLARHAAGAAGRQIERRLREPFADRGAPRILRPAGRRPARR